MEAADAQEHPASPSWQQFSLALQAAVSHACMSSSATCLPETVSAYTYEGYAALKYLQA